MVYFTEVGNGDGQQPLLGVAPVGFSSQSQMTRQQPAYMARPNMLPTGSMASSRRPAMMMNPSQMGPEFADEFGMQEVPSFSQSPVLMMYGLNAAKMNCDRVFNILCLYGNVMKVKFLQSKTGTAMVQMGDPLAVDRAISGLSGMRFFQEKLSLAPSKQMYLNDTLGNTTLDDGSPTQVDYSNSKDNRFTTTEQAAKNRIQNPSKVLHYYNAPVSFDEEKLGKICADLEIIRPAKFVAFKSKTERSSSGLMQFDTRGQALECLAVANHYKVDNPNHSRYPYIVKLCFSTSSIQNYPVNN